MRLSFERVTDVEIQPHAFPIKRLASRTSDLSRPTIQLHAQHNLTQHPLRTSLYFAFAVVQRSMQRRRSPAPLLISSVVRLDIIEFFDASGFRVWASRIRDEALTASANVQLVQPCARPWKRRWATEPSMVGFAVLCACERGGG